MMIEHSENEFQIAAPDTFAGKEINAEAREKPEGEAPAWGSPPSAQCVCCRRALAYVTNNSSNTVSLVEIPTGRKVLDISVGSKPYGIDISPDREFVYVANSDDATLSVISTRSNQVAQTIALNTPSFSAAFSYWVKVSSDGSLIYVTNKLSNNISIVDANQKEVVAEIPLPVGTAPLKLGITAGSRLGFVTLFDTAQVAVVDLAVNLPVKYIDVGKEPSGISVSRNNSLILSVNSSGSSLSAIDPLLAEASPNTIAVGDPADVIFDPYDNIAYVSSWGANDSEGNVGIVDVFSHRQIATILVGINPKGLALTADGRFLVVSNLGEATVSIIDTKIRTVIATAPVGEAPEFIAVLN